MAGSTAQVVEIDVVNDVSRPAPQGERHCVVTALSPYLPELRGYLRRRVPAPDVDDVVQDIFVRLVNRGDGVVSFPRRYLYQAAVTILIDRYRMDRARCRPLHCELDEVHHPPEERSPDRVLLAREELRLAQRILAGLPVRTRQILVAVRIEGSSLKSVAQDHGISVSAVEKHLIRALRALKDARRMENDAPLRDVAC